MNKCREQFEEYCKKFNIRPEGNYAKDVYEFWQAAWNLRPSTTSAPEGAAFIPEKIGNPPSTEDRRDAERYRKLKNRIQLGCYQLWYWDTDRSSWYVQDIDAAT